MQQSAKQFADQLNRCLDDLGVPINIRERSAALSKMIHIPKQQAWSLLEGHVFPDSQLLQEIANELEIDPNSLLRKNEK